MPNLKATMMKKIKDRRRHGFVLLCGCSWVRKKLRLWESFLLPLSHTTEKSNKTCAVSDWQLVLFEVCLCLCMFEVAIEKKQWHHSCTVTICKDALSSQTVLLRQEMIKWSGECAIAEEISFVHCHHHHFFALFSSFLAVCVLLSSFSILPSFASLLAWGETGKRRMFFSLSHILFHLHSVAFLKALTLGMEIKSSLCH